MAKFRGLLKLAMAFVPEGIFFSSSGLGILEYDLIFVRLNLDCCVRDDVICQDILFKERQVLITASPIMEFSSQIQYCWRSFPSLA